MVIENIRSIIAEKGLKQKAVAEKAGFTPQEFSNILNDRRKLIRVEHIAPIAVALGVEPNDLYASGAREGAQAGGNPSGENIAG
ncbi:MAG: helix-turn-helix transcriptional regulator [Lachnospiraceae bacterium]|nr:helix-turn-helix transcriptional regulator [Lachnospiraceae bacterium]